TLDDDEGMAGNPVLSVGGYAWRSNSASIRLSRKFSRRGSLARQASSPGETKNEDVLNMSNEQTADLVIIGGGTGGCAAAMAAVALGLRVIMSEETDWIGGQLTSQAVPPDEHPWIETQGCTATYRR